MYIAINLYCSGIFFLNVYLRPLSIAANFMVLNRKHKDFVTRHESDIKFETDELHSSLIIDEDNESFLAVYSM